MPSDLNLDHLDPDVRFRIRELMLAKPRTQSERAELEDELIQALRATHRPGRRTDLQKTCTQDCEQVPKPKRRDSVYDIIGKWREESGETVRERHEVHKAAKADPESYGKLLQEMDDRKSPHRAYLRLQDMRFAEKIRNEPPLPKPVPVVQRGEHWIVGDHNVQCGDAGSRHDLEQLMGGKMAALTVFSPPYNLSIEKSKPGMFQSGGWRRKVRSLAYNDSMPEDEYQARQKHILQLVHDVVLKENGSFFLKHRNRSREKELISADQLLPGPFKLRQKIVWPRSGHTTFTARMFQPCHEMIYWLYKGEDYTFMSAPHIAAWGDVWQIPNEPNEHHPAAFPIELPRRCIEACSRPGEVVADIFLGSGTTLIAAELMGRKCFGMEIDPGFCSSAIERWQNFTGKPAKLDETGQNYDQVKAERLGGAGQ